MQLVQTLISKEEPTFRDQEPTSLPLEVSTEQQQMLQASGNLLTAICKPTHQEPIPLVFSMHKPTDFPVHLSFSPSILTKNILGERALDTTQRALQQPQALYFLEIPK